VKCTIHAHVLVAHVHGAYNAATHLGVHVKMVLGPVVHDKHSTGPGRRRLVAVRGSGHLRAGITCYVRVTSVINAEFSVRPRHAILKHHM